ncbi:MAG: 3-dehydroquinate synthase [Janthinobacterium lividum]
MRMANSQSALMRLQDCDNQGVTSIPVKTDSADYQVHIGPGLLPMLAAETVRLAGKVSRVFVVTSPEIDRLWAKPIREGFAAQNVEIETLLIPAGEQYKRLPTLERLCEELAGHGADRDSLLVALGGGVIGDITGFLAAIYMRGIQFVQVPTTLLAQVDSSVGGKTGVNLQAGKNLVGSFYHPLAVFADMDTLATLPVRELRAGLQESVKAGVIRDAALFHFMEANTDQILRGDATALQQVVEASVRMKADVVGEDERELGVRMNLNFGHTVGHAIEAATGYKALLHGEAIGWGMIAAVHLGLARGVLSAGDADRIVALIHRCTDLPPFTAEAQQLVALTGSDKKKRSGTLSFVLPVAIGKVEIVRDVTEAELTEAVRAMLIAVNARQTVNS